MNRRTFLRRLSAAAIGTAAVVSVPVPLLRAVGLGPAAERHATHILHLAWAEAYRTGRVAREMHVGTHLFTAYEGELTPIYRFTSGDWPHHALCFRGARVVAVGPGWGCRVASSDARWRPA